ncbi:MAG TPA: ester cyclase [Longimicrobiales bacterium]|nr:ester cyclase [Longimicrobiales bacterium]
MDSANVQATYRCFDELWNHGREEVIDQLLAPDHVAYNLGGRNLRGREEYRQFYRAFRRSFPNLHVTIDRTIEHGDEVAFRGRAVIPIPGMETPHVMHGGGFLRFCDGRITERWSLWDFLGLLAHAGAIRADIVPAMLSAFGSEPETHPIF